MALFDVPGNLPIVSQASKRRERPNQGTRYEYNKRETDERQQGGRPVDRSGSQYGGGQHGRYRQPGADDRLQDSEHAPSGADAVKQSPNLIVGLHGLFCPARHESVEAEHNHHHDKHILPERLAILLPPGSDARL